MASGLRPGDFCTCEVGSSDLARFSGKPRRPVLVVHLQAEYAAVYPLSRSPAGTGDAELVHELWNEGHSYLVRSQGLFCVPIASLEPLGVRYADFPALRAQVDAKLLQWKRKHHALLHATPTKSKPRDGASLADRGVSLPNVPAPPTPRPTKGPERDLFAEELARLERPAPKGEDGRLTAKLGDVSALEEVRRRLEAPPPPTPRSAPAGEKPKKPKEKDVDFAAAVEAWSKDAPKKLSGKPQPKEPPPKASPDAPEEPDPSDTRLRPGFRRS